MPDPRAQQLSVAALVFETFLLGTLIFALIFSYLGNSSWLDLQRCSARLFLWFAFQSVSAVTSPLVAQPLDDASSVEPPWESEP